METAISIIGQAIQELGSKRGLTLDQVVERSGGTPRFLLQVERNKATPSVTTLYCAAKAIGVPETYSSPNSTSPVQETRHHNRENFHFADSAVSRSSFGTELPHASPRGWTDQSDERCLVMSGTFRIDPSAQLVATARSTLQRAR